MNSVQVMDKLCPTPHLSQALAISSSKAEDEPPLQVSVSLHQVHHAAASSAATPVTFHDSGAHHRHGTAEGGGSEIDVMRYGRSRASERRQRRVSSCLRQLHIQRLR